MKQKSNMRIVRPKNRKKTADTNRCINNDETTEAEWEKVIQFNKLLIFPAHTVIKKIILWNVWWNYSKNEALPIQKFLQWSIKKQDYRTKWHSLFKPNNLKWI